MRINGKKYLSNNSYHRIVIKIVNDEYVINISGKDDNFKTINLSNDFIDTVKFLDDDHKVLEIVNHFLRNNLVTGLSYAEYYRNDKHFNVVNGGDRVLMLQIKNNEIGKKVVDNINQKYLLDRARYPFKDGSYMIATSDKKCCYQDHFIYLKRNKDKQVSKEDMEFLKAFLLSKIDINYKTILYYKDKIINNNKSQFLFSDDVIDVDFIRKIAENSNKEFSKNSYNKQLQLKL